MVTFLKSLPKNGNESVTRLGLYRESVYCYKGYAAVIYKQTVDAVRKRGFPTIIDEKDLPKEVRKYFISINRINPTQSDFIKEVKPEIIEKPKEIEKVDIKEPEITQTQEEPIETIEPEIAQKEEEAIESKEQDKPKRDDKKLNTFPKLPMPGMKGVTIIPALCKCGCGEQLPVPRFFNHVFIKGHKDR